MNVASLRNIVGDKEDSIQTSNTPSLTRNNRHMQKKGGRVGARKRAPLPNQATVIQNDTTTSCPPSPSPSSSSSSHLDDEMMVVEECTTKQQEEQVDFKEDSKEKFESSSPTRPPASTVGSTTPVVARQFNVDKTLYYSNFKETNKPAADAVAKKKVADVQEESLWKTVPESSKKKKKKKKKKDSVVHSNQEKSKHDLLESQQNELDSSHIIEKSLTRLLSRSASGPDRLVSMSAAAAVAKKMAEAKESLGKAVPESSKKKESVGHSNQEKSKNDLLESQQKELDSSYMIEKPLARLLSRSASGPDQLVSMSSTILSGGTASVSSWSESTQDDSASPKKTHPSGVAAVPGTKNSHNTSSSPNMQKKGGRIGARKRTPMPSQAAGLQNDNTTASCPTSSSSSSSQLDNDKHQHTAAQSAENKGHSLHENETDLSLTETTEMGINMESHPVSSPTAKAQAAAAMVEGSSKQQEEQVDSSPNQKNSEEKVKSSAPTQPPASPAGTTIARRLNVDKMSNSTPEANKPAAVVAKKVADVEEPLGKSVPESSDEKEVVVHSHQEKSKNDLLESQKELGSSHMKEKPLARLLSRSASGPDRLRSMMSTLFSVGAAAVSSLSESSEHGNAVVSSSKTHPCGVTAVPCTKNSHATSTTTNSSTAPSLWGNLGRRHSISSGAMMESHPLVSLECKKASLRATLVALKNMHQSFQTCPCMTLEREEYAAILAVAGRKHGCADSNDDDDINGTINALETALIQQMHHTISTQKQLDMMKEQHRDVKKYLVHSKAGLRDCQVLDDHMNDLQAQNYAMSAVYRNTVKKQEAAIEKYRHLI